MDDTSRANRPLSLDPGDVDRRTRTFRRHVEDAHWWLGLALAGAVPLGEAVTQADAAVAQAARMLIDGPVDGWPCNEAA